MQVIKRDGTKQDIHFDKILTRITNLTKMEPSLPNVNMVLLTQKVIAGLKDDILTTELDELAADAAIFMSTIHYDYATLATRVAISNLHKQTSASFLVTTETLKHLLSPTYIEHVKNNIDAIQNALNYALDYEYDFFGFKILCKSYLFKVNNIIVERPQHMLMRVAVGIHGNDIENALKSYYYMSHKYFTHATPTLFNAGTPTPQLASCFLMTMIDDSVEGIYDSLKRSAIISKYSGGQGISVHDIRCEGATIKSNGGTAGGLIPMLKLFNDCANHIDQASKRKGSISIYLEPHHPDVEHFLELKLNTGKEENRCRDLFYAMWISDFFMNCVKNNENWSLFCPSECPGLSDVYGEEYEQLYKKYESEGKARKVIKAQDLWFKILTSQMETGTPYMLYKDTINKHNNQKNLGTIKSSNLCTEICEYTAPDEVSVCTLASLGLPSFIVDGVFDHQKLYDACYYVTLNLNKVIDINYYPVDAAKYSNLKHRPIGIGIQGLADVFIILKYPYDSPEAKILNQEIMETIYFGAATCSNDLAQRDGVYSSYENSPISKEILTFDSWNHTPTNRWNFNQLRENIKKYGMRNSLLISLMPTASTSGILGYIECAEPIHSHIYTRRVLAGEFIMTNKYLMKDLIKLGLWNEQMKQKIIENNGSIQKINNIPNDIKLLYRNVWELKMKDLMDMCRDRSVYVCQSQSFNCFMSAPNKAKLTSMHFYGWEIGLKTGMYYLRTQAATNAIQFTINKESKEEIKENKEECKEEICNMCGA